MPTLFPDDTKSIIEALLFVSSSPVQVKTLAEITEQAEEDIISYLAEIKADCEREMRGFQLIQIAQGYSFVTRAEFAQYVEKLLKPRLSTLSQAALETLAMVAYKQPITKIEIDEIRGVKSDSAVSTLVERDLIEEVGRKEGPGRPIIYGTTTDFLKHFGLKSLEELPDKKDDLITDIK